MSAFVVEKETINKILHLLSIDEMGRPTHTICREYPDNDGTLYSWADRHGAKLWALNEAAVAYRYSQEVNEPEAFSWWPALYSIEEMCKAAVCWCYQCSEGEQFTSDPLFQEVKKASTKAAWLIVDKSEAYNKAKWG